MGRDIAVVTGGVSGIGKAITDGLRAARAPLVAAVVLLAAGRLDYMNGAAWVIDGGWTAL